MVVLNFFEALNKALDDLNSSDSLVLEWSEHALSLSHVRALSYRLLRNARSEKVKTFKLCIRLAEEEAEECVSVLEHLLRCMKQVNGLFLSNLGPEYSRRLCGVCPALERVAVGCRGVSQEECIRASSLLDLASPARLQKLGLGYIRGDEMDGFASAFSKMHQLEELSMGLGYGMNPETFATLMSSLSTSLKHSLKALYLWGPDEPPFQLTASCLNGLTNVLRNNSELLILSLEDLPNLFSHCGKHSSAVQAFCTELRSSQLNELMLEGDLGIQESTAIQIFGALETNTCMRKIRLKGVPLSVTPGYKSMMNSLAKNSHLQELFLRTTTTEDLDQVMLDQVVVRGLHQNAGITFFCTFIEELGYITEDGNFQEWHICSNSSDELEALAARNSCITLTRDVAPTLECFPTSLLPRAMERISIRGGGCHAAFPLIQNLSSRLGEGLAPVPKSPNYHNKQKKRRAVCSNTRACSAVKRRSQRLKKGGNP